MAQPLLLDVDAEALITDDEVCFEFNQAVPPFAAGEQAMIAKHRADLLVTKHAGRIVPERELEADRKKLAEAVARAKTRVPRGAGAVREG